MSGKSGDLLRATKWGFGIPLGISIFTLLGIIMLALIYHGNYVAAALGSETDEEARKNELRAELKLYFGEEDGERTNKNINYLSHLFGFPYTSVYTSIQQEVNDLERIGLALSIPSLVDFYSFEGDPTTHAATKNFEQFRFYWRERLRTEYWNIKAKERSETTVEPEFEVEGEELRERTRPREYNLAPNIRTEVYGNEPAARDVVPGYTYQPAVPLGNGTLVFVSQRDMTYHKKASCPALNGQVPLEATVGDATTSGYRSCYRCRW